MSRWRLGCVSKTSSRQIPLDSTSTTRNTVIEFISDLRLGNHRRNHWSQFVSLASSFRLSCQRNWETKWKWNKPNTNFNQTIFDKNIFFDFLFFFFHDEQKLPINPPYNWPLMWDFVSSVNLTKKNCCFLPIMQKIKFTALFPSSLNGGWRVACGQSGMTACSAGVCDDLTSGALLCHNSLSRQSCYMFLLLSLPSPLSGILVNTDSAGRAGRLIAWFHST